MTAVALCLLIVASQPSSEASSRLEITVDDAGTVKQKDAVLVKAGEFGDNDRLVQVLVARRKDSRHVTVENGVAYSREALHLKVDGACALEPFFQVLRRAYASGGFLKVEVELSTGRKAALDFLRPRPDGKPRVPKGPNALIVSLCARGNLGNHIAMDAEHSTRDAVKEKVTVYAERRACGDLPAKPKSDDKTAKAAFAELKKVLSDLKSMMLEPVGEVIVCPGTPIEYLLEAMQVVRDVGLGKPLLVLVGFGTIEQ